MSREKISLSEVQERINSSLEVQDLARHCLLRLNEDNLKPGSIAEIYMTQLFNIDVLFLKGSVLVMDAHYIIDEKWKEEYIDHSYYFTRFYSIEPDGSALSKKLSEPKYDRITKIHYFCYHFAHRWYLSKEVIYNAYMLTTFYKNLGKKLIFHICKYQYQRIKDFLNDPKLIEADPEIMNIYRSINISIDEGSVFRKGNEYYLFSSNNVLYRGDFMNINDIKK